MISAGGCEAQDFCENDRVFNDLDIRHRPSYDIKFHGEEYLFDD